MWVMHVLIILMCLEPEALPNKTHTQTHICMHAYTHIHIHTQKHTRTYTEGEKHIFYFQYYHYNDDIVHNGIPRWISLDDSNSQRRLILKQTIFEWYSLMFFIVSTSLIVPTWNLLLVFVTSQFLILILKPLIFLNL